MNVDIKILGTFELSISGMSVVPTANKPSQVLALLALNAGRVVTVDVLAEELWDQNPPRSATSTLQTYVLKLRRRLRDVPGNGPGAPADVLITRRNGYLLDLPVENVDAVMYDRLSAMGRAAFDGSDYAAASRTLNAALGLWRGTALSDVTTGPLLQIEALRLEETRLSDIGLRVDSDLCLGRHQQLLCELAALCARYPLLESFRAQHMIALYRAGRQWQAMQVYRDTRETVVDQLGVEPSPRLRQLHRALLSGHPMMADPDFVFSNWLPQRQSNRAAIS